MKVNTEENYAFLRSVRTPFEQDSCDARAVWHFAICPALNVPKGNILSGTEGSLP